MSGCPTPPQVWTISFDSDGGSDVDEQQVSSTITKPEDSTKSGYLLEGWYYDTSLNHRWDFTSDTEGDRTLFAKWQRDYAILRSTDIAEQDRFGISVAISENTAIIGDESSSHQGSAYIFVRDGLTWTQQAKLVADDPEDEDFFGHSVDISGDTVIIGASKEDDDYTSSGSAYIFTRDGTAWTLQEKLTASDAAIFNEFGSSVAIDGDNVIIGASGYENGDETEVGCAYFFTRTDGNWTEQDKLVDNDATKSVTFGADVDISEDTVILNIYKQTFVIASVLKCK